MPKQQKKYRVVKPFMMPDGTKAGQGATVELTKKQAKYLLIARKILDATAPAAAQRTGSGKTDGKAGKADGEKGDKL